MAANGRLASSALAPIPSGRLRKDAAAAFNAMNAESVRRFGVTLHPTGPMSSYRNLAGQQYFWNLYRSGRGNLAARPGTSNHGWGLAVDFATPRMRAIVDRIGRKYGWAKAWSDAPSEWWHIRWRPGRYAAVKPARPTLRRGQKGPSIRALQRILRKLGFKSVPGPGKKGYGYFGRSTSSAVKRVQKKHHLPADGVVGARTWAALR